MAYCRSCRDETLRLTRYCAGSSARSFPTIVGAASSIVVMHNHPSGEATPSEGDIKVTRDLIRAGQLLKVELIDHGVIGANTHCSLGELGWLIRKRLWKRFTAIHVRVSTDDQRTDSRELAAFCARRTGTVRGSIATTFQGLKQPVRNWIVSCTKSEPREWSAWFASSWTDWAAV